MLRFRLVTAAVLSLLLITGPVCADGASPITIVNSGSTNMSGYTINVSPDGSTAYDNGSGRKHGTLPPDLTQKLFEDVQAAVPFTQLGPVQCMKSVSFGTVTTITYNGDHSPDISCLGNPKGAKIYQDVQNVQKGLGMASVPRHSGVPNPINQSNTSPG